MIPKFNPNGLLPPGIHSATINDVKTRLVYNQQRKELFEGFLKGIQSLKKCGCECVYLDGSFVTSKEFPNDFDACWDESGVSLFNLKVIEPVLLEFSNNRAAQKAKFKGEFFPANRNAETKHPHRAFINFFQIDKKSGNPKGILEIKL